MRKSDEKIKKVNRLFDIQLTGKNFLEPVCKAVRYDGLVETIGKRLADKYVDKVLESTDHTPLVFTLRRGLKITFYDRTS